MQKYLCSCILTWCALWPAWVQGVEPSADQQALEMEISHLDETTRKFLVQEMLGQLNRTESQTPDFKSQAPASAAAPVPRAYMPEDRTSSFAPSTSASPVLSSPPARPADQALWQPATDFSLPHKFESRGDFLPFESSTTRQSVIIPEQPDNPLMLTVGDLIYFPTPAFRPLHPEERYGIYKLVKYHFLKNNAAASVGLEAIGRIRILEVNRTLTIARVVSAKDIIRQNDLIYLTDQQ